MAPHRKFFVIGNWKMNVNKAKIDSLAKEITARTWDSKTTETVIACSPCYLSYVRKALPSHMGVAAQNCYKVARGNYSGEISPNLIRDCGCDWVILGHPERRTVFGESDELIGEKVAHAQQEGMKIVLCLCADGKASSDEGDLMVQQQLKTLTQIVTDWSKVVVAWEDLGASRCGVALTPARVQQVLSDLRNCLREQVSDLVAESTRFIYAGSVTSANCRELGSLQDLDGFLVGSASLKKDLVDIFNARNTHVARLSTPASGGVLLSADARTSASASLINMLSHCQV